MSDVRVITNNHRRPVIEAYELTLAERQEFAYVDWQAIDNGMDSASFFRFRGELYDLGEFEHLGYPYFDRSVESWRSAWHGIQTDSFFSATVIRYVGDGNGDEWDHVVVGRVFS